MIAHTAAWARSQLDELPRSPTPFCNAASQQWSRSSLVATQAPRAHEARVRTGQAAPPSGTFFVAIGNARPIITPAIRFASSRKSALVGTTPRLPIRARLACPACQRSTESSRVVTRDTVALPPSRSRTQGRRASVRTSLRTLQDEAAVTLVGMGPMNSPGQIRVLRWRAPSPVLSPACRQSAADPRSPSCC
jgi:hypothetical protein